MPLAHLWQPRPPAGLLRGLASLIAETNNLQLCVEAPETSHLVLLPHIGELLAFGRPGEAAEQAAAASDDPGGVFAIALHQPDFLRAYGTAHKGNPGAIR